MTGSWLYSCCPMLVDGCALVVGCALEVGCALVAGCALFQMLTHGTDRTGSGTCGPASNQACKVPGITNQRQRSILIRPPQQQPQQQLRKKQEKQQQQATAAAAGTATSMQEDSSRQQSEQHIQLGVNTLDSQTSSGARGCTMQCIMPYSLALRMCAGYCYLYCCAVCHAAGVWLLAVSRPMGNVVQTACPLSVTLPQIACSNGQQGLLELCQSCGCNCKPGAQCWWLHVTCYHTCNDNCANTIAVCMVLAVRSWGAAAAAVMDTVQQYMIMCACSEKEQTCTNTNGTM